MTPTTLNKVLLGLGWVVAAVGAVDAALGRDRDLLVVFVLVLAFQGVLLVRLNRSRPAVPLRADIVRWLRREAALSGEPLEQIAHRAVAIYRSGMLSGGAGGEEGPTR